MPFAASLIYVFGTLFLKQAEGRGAGLWRSAAVTNLITAAVFLVLLPLGGRLPEPTPWIQPALTAALFLVGQVFGFFAIHRGDVSVATPVMGIKVVLVAFFVTWILGVPVPAAVWVGAALSSGGIALLSRGGRQGAGKSGPAIVFGALAAATFAVFDVLVQKWAPAWGAGRFLPVMMGFMALYSAPLFLLSRKQGETLSREARRPLIFGGFFLAVQGTLLITALALFKDATTINVVYSGRGLWSVLAVWIVGHWFGNREQHLAPAVLRARLAGAALLVAAIVLVVVAR